MILQKRGLEWTQRHGGISFTYETTQTDPQSDM